MSYAVVNDLVERYGAAELTQLTDRASPPAGTYDPAVVQKALDDADAIANSYLSAQATVPLATTPPAIVIQCCKIARWFLWKDRRSEAVTADYNDAIKWLTAVAQGLIPIGDGAPEQTGGQPKVISQPRIFTRDTLKGF